MAIPYFTLPKIPIVVTKLEPFGILVATGVLLGSWIARKRAEKLNLDDDQLRVLIGYILVCGFIGAHVFDVLWYQQEKFAEDRWLLLRIWEGISSYGGFIGAAIGLVLFVWRHRPAHTLALADAICWGLLPGFAFGRLGCTVVHDHPGSVTDFFLGFSYPNGVIHGLPAAIRHNLGFYEFLYLALIGGVFWLLTRWQRPVGFAVGFLCIAYAPVRFYLERFRLESSDPRYLDALNWTFAQYASVVTLLGGVAIMVYAYKRKWTPEEIAASRPEKPEEKKKSKKKSRRKVKS